MKHSSKSGFSLVEFSIAIVMTLLVLGGSSMMLTRGSEQFRNGAAEASSTVRIGRSLDEIVEALRMASAESLRVGAPAPVGSSWIEFRRALGMNLATGEVRFGERERIELRPDPALVAAPAYDLVWITDLGLESERTRVVGRGVRRSLEGEIPGNQTDDNGNGLVDEPGLCFDLRQGRVDVHLTLDTENAVGGVARTNVLRSVSTRNR